jgi:hypothetical protein
MKRRPPRRLSRRILRIGAGARDRSVRRLPSQGRFVRYAPDRSPTGVAIGWPVANIRHRFGGYLRAAWDTDFRDAVVKHRRHLPINGRDQNRAAHRHLMA